MAEFATIAQIAALTGVTVDAATRNLAAQAVELATGQIEAVQRENATDRDLYWLRLACAYQAVWLQAQPDYLTRNNVQQVSQDGQSVTGGADWLALGPLARKAVRKLSWRSPRMVGRPDLALKTDRDPLSEGSDVFQHWSPL